VAIFFAILSLSFAGLNDFVFKQYIHRDGQLLGTFVLVVGMVWTGVFAAATLAFSGGFTSIGWPIALGAGLASLAANLLFITSFRMVPAGTGATVYRLNLVLAAILGIVLLHEPLNVWKFAGIILGGAAVVLMSNSKGRNDQLARSGILALAAACGLRAVMGILYKVSSLESVPQFEMLTIGGACWIGGGLAFCLLRRQRVLPSRRTTGFALLSGLLVCGIVYFMLEATRLGQASIVLPVSQLSFIVTMILGVAFHKEELGARKLLALAVAVACIVALSRG
jgi:drug/metabolite transporter (DMT)-like permease